MIYGMSVLMYCLHAVKREACSSSGYTGTLSKALTLYNHSNRALLRLGKPFYLVPVSPPVHFEGVENRDFFFLWTSDI